MRYLYTVFDFMMQLMRVTFGIAMGIFRFFICKSLDCMRGIWDKIRYLFEILGELRFVSDIFDDWVIRAAGIVLMLLLGTLAFNIFFVHFQMQYPFLMLISLVMALVFVIAGGILFFVAIVKYND
ncbi:hypothetical protein ACFLYS_03360 [Chloroflexota bacterium]